MSLQEIESEVAHLSKSELTAFTVWFENYIANAWDAQIESDIAAGKLDHQARQADEHFEAGQCTPGATRHCS